MNSKKHARVTAPSAEILEKRKESRHQLNRKKKLKKKLKKHTANIVVNTKCSRNQKPMVDSYLPRNKSPDHPMEIHVELGPGELEEPVELDEPDETVCFFNKGPNGEFLGGNSDVYRTLGFGWVSADDPTRAEWAEFCKTGFDCSGISDCMDIVEKYYPNWRTEKRPPRSRSRSRTWSPPSDRRSSTPENPEKDQPSISSL